MVFEMLLIFLTGRNKNMDKPWTNHGQNMDKPWTNHGQTTCICLGVEARFMETQIKIFIMFNLFPNTYLNIFQKKHCPN